MIRALTTIGDLVSLFIAERADVDPVADTELILTQHEEPSQEVLHHRLGTETDRDADQPAEKKPLTMRHMLNLPEPLELGLLLSQQFSRRVVPGPVRPSLAWLARD